MRKRIIVRGPALSRSGYGEQTRFALRSLRAHEDEYDIYLIAVGWGQTGWVSTHDEERAWIDSLVQKTQFYQSQGGKYDMSLQVTIPNEWEKLAPVNVGYTAGIETTRIAPQWIEKSQLMDKIIVVSEHAKWGFDNTEYSVQDNRTGQVTSGFKCETPVEVVNYPVREYDPADIDLGLETEFNFLAVAQWSIRKNMDNTVKWFVEEFKDDEDVGLVLKVTSKNGSKLDRNNTKVKLQQQLANYPGRKCKVYLLHGDMSEQEMTGLYQHPKIKALVTLTHGEGFGLPIFEAAYNGLPVISPAWSGQCDFLFMPVKNKKGRTKTRPGFLKVDYEMKPIQKEAIWKTVLEEDSMWCYPKDNSYKIRLREVTKDYPRIKSQAKRLQKHILKNFTAEKMYKQFSDAVCSVADLGEIVFDEDLVESGTTAELTSAVKKVMKNTGSQKDKIEFLKDKYKGRKCIIVSCGPSLAEHDLALLKQSSLLKDNVVFTIKQAYDFFKEETDFHIYNCANFKQYDYTRNNPIIVEASSIPERLGPCDIRFPIYERRFEKSLSVEKNFDDWTYENQPELRPYGPGIMYETVFYLAEHIGVSEIVTIGWDNKLRDDTDTKQHFYELIDDEKNIGKYVQFNRVSDNKTAVQTLPEEAQMTVDVMGEWHNWLNSKGIDLNIISDLNPAPDYVPRLDLANMIDVVVL